MPWIFHQNMRVYGGCSANRNQAFATAFENLSGNTNPGCIVCGYTELRNNGVPLHDNLAGYSNQLFIASDRAAKGSIIEIGISGREVSEHVGIFWDASKLQVQRIGFSNQDGLDEYKAGVEVIGRNHQCTYNMPLRPGLHQADKRGLAFIAGSDKNGQKWLIGFMHNMYGTGDRYGGFENIPNLLKAALGALSDSEWAQSEDIGIVVGGDFNVEPRSFTERNSDGLVPYASVDQNGKPELTTDHHAIDFWIVNEVFIGRCKLIQQQGQDVPNIVPGVHQETHDQLCSDHAGISLWWDDA